MARSSLFQNRQPGGLITLEDMGRSTGTRFYVLSTSGNDSAGQGRDPGQPFATLDYAIGQCTANAGDIIYVLPGHAETYSTSATHVINDVAGVKVIGIGEGANRPTFTFSHTGAAWTITAASVTVENLLLVCGVNSVAAPLTISASDCTLRKVEWRDATSIEFVRSFITTAAADRLTVEDCYHNGYTSGTVCVNFCRLVGCDTAVFRRNRFLGEYSTAVIEFHTTACTKIDVENCLFLETGTTNLSKNIVDTVTGSTWAVRDCYDLGAGAFFSGGSGGALAADDLSAVTDALYGTTGIVSFPSSALPANGVSLAEVLREKYDQQEKAVTNTTATLVNGTTLFTIAGGPIEILSLVARCVTTNDATASTLQWSADPTDGVAVTFSAASASLASVAAGGMVVLQGTTLATAPLVSASGVNIAQQVTNGIVVGAGIITSVVGVGSTTGTWQHHLRYRPLSRGVTVT